MKNLSLFILTLGFVVSCASSRPFNMGLVQAEAIRVSNDPTMYFMNIPSRGAIADAALIAANGGGIAKQLGSGLNKIHQSGGGSITISSANPALPQAVIQGALALLEFNVENLLLIYAGELEYSDSIETVVEEKGFTYKFIDISKFN